MTSPTRRQMLASLAAIVAAPALTLPRGYRWHGLREAYLEAESTEALLSSGWVRLDMRTRVTPGGGRSEVWLAVDVDCKVRDDFGRWVDIEEFRREHPDAD